MRTRITVLFVAVLTACFSLQAQNLLVDDFETGGKFGCYGTDITIAVVENPGKTDVNSSDYVLKMEGTNASENWAGINYIPEQFGNLPITVGNVDVVNEGEYRYVHFKLHRNNDNKVLVQLKLDDGNAEYPEELWTGGTNTWEYYVMDLLYKAEWSYDLSNKQYNQIEFQPNKQSGAFVLYIDDIYLSPSPDPITTSAIKNNKINSADINVYRSANGSAFARIGELEGQLKLEVYNLQGQLLKVVYNDVAAMGNYELPSFETGIYILKATTSKGTYSLKF